MVVSWLVLLNLIRSYVLYSSEKFTNKSSEVKSYLMVIFFASTYSTTPSASAIRSALESIAALLSKPVPTIGASGFIKGTA